MKWQDNYKRKICSSEQAVAHICSGDRVVLGHACGEPQELVNAMVKRAGELRDVEVVHMVAMGNAAYCRPEYQTSFIHNSLFAGGTTRQAIKEGRANYTPCFFYEIPRLFREGYLPVDVALVQLSKPDAHGYMSFNISVDYTKVACESARTVIALVNVNAPRTLGDSFVHVSEVDCIVETSAPLIELKPPVIGSIEEAIGRNIADLIPDGATLQLGIGAIPDAVLMFLREKNDLGIHTEMFSDGVVKLYEAGVITNKKKSIHKGKMVATFLMGTQKLYDFVNDNPAVEMFTVDYTNNPAVISQNNSMISINSALQIDLAGQVCAESIGFYQYSGTGGQVDYVRGASVAPGGKAIIALPATASGGRFSRICPKLDEGATVTTSRNDVHYVVTEFGAVNLRGKSIKERARALISIAHPDFRKELVEEIKAKRSFVM